MEQRRNPVPGRPFYLSQSDEILLVWATKFEKGVKLLGDKYGIPKTEQDAVAAALLVIIAYMGRWERAKTYYEACIVAKKSYFDRNPANPTANVPFAILEADPADFVLPAPMPGNILYIFVKVAEAILAQNPVQADLITLGLVQAEGKPLPPNYKKRLTADDVTYPLISVKLTITHAIIGIKKSTLRKNGMVRLMLDTEGYGQFVKLNDTNAKEYFYEYKFPEGLLTMALTFKAIYLEGQTEVGDWSPELTVPIRRQSAGGTPPPTPPAENPPPVPPLE